MLRVVSRVAGCGAAGSVAVSLLLASSAFAFDFKVPPGAPPGEKAFRAMIGQGETYALLACLVCAIAGGASWAIGHALHSAHAAERGKMATIIAPAAAATIAVLPAFLTAAYNAFSA